MDAQRAQYLHDLGITVWERRGLFIATDPAGLSGDDNTSLPSDARATAIAQMDWPELETTVKSCTACRLRTGCTQTVFGVGNRHAEWLVIGEAPGAEEDRQGEPFVGRAGQLLNSMLAAIGLKREQVYITNIVKCRPPSNRDPALDEAAACRPFLDRQIALIQPKLILAVGRVAAQSLLGTDVPVGRLRGRVHQLQGIPVVVTYHPAYLLRSPQEKRKAWADLQFAVHTLKEHTA
ncbi:MAG: uracil-DNA glycosylase [Gammaproteobacteria bacterium]|nr:uracil-DNA glycosylase [Gammaproteobacteria bacterium]MBU6509879.1 uracil-DNA glycosylase [Gammaproteobacteria bacterium]MDE1984211.1 uracil-DNA glycosylase [Gammaproteobacteria bacterium]MDE2108481.1 uracil-DNA glycosylase [Gammaproteobacteria bacterium]MDE2460779.1 uracil-DNA glycosylase [Gammaproteobacteria bacterium]